MILEIFEIKNLILRGECPVDIRLFAGGCQV
jgi:hypothetical protein